MPGPYTYTADGQSCQTPKPFTWREEFATMYRDIDDEHKGLFDALNDLDKDQKNSGALATLVKVTADHFRAEEAKMKAKKYSGVDAHMKLHAAFEEKLSKMSCPLPEKDLEYSCKWLCAHIKEHDFKYKGKLD